MKGEFRDKDSHPSLPTTTTTTIFSNLHHHHHQPPPSPPPLFAAVSHQHLTTTTTSTSDELNNKKHFTTNDGASIEVVRRPRGRPPGSRNKPKPPPQPPIAAVITTQQPNSSMSPHVLEVVGGLDIIAAVSRFCNHHKTSVCVLSGSGTVSNVTFRQPTTTITFHGCFELLSISATVLPSSYPPPSAILTSFSNRFAISLAGPQGQTVGGAVAGPLIAAGTVYIVAATFNNPLYHRLPMEAEEEEEEEDNHIRSSGGGSVSGGGDGGRRQHAPPSTAVDSVSMYSCQPPPASDVIWAPTPRLARPHSPKDCFF